MWYSFPPPKRALEVRSWTNMDFFPLFVGEKVCEGISLQHCLGKLHYVSAKNEVICCQICAQARAREQACLCGGSDSAHP